MIAFRSFHLFGGGGRESNPPATAIAAKPVLKTVGPPGPFLLQLLDFITVFIIPAPQPKTFMLRNSLPLCRRFAVGQFGGLVLGERLRSLNQTLVTTLDIPAEHDAGLVPRAESSQGSAISPASNPDGSQPCA